MESSSEWVAIKFCFKASKTATETVEMVCADEALMWSEIFRWCGWFHERREDNRDYPRCSRPSESRVDGNIENVRQLLLQNRHLSVWMIVDEPDISEDTVQKIVIEDLKKGSLHAICTAHIDCRTGEPRWCLSRFDWVHGQWSWLL